MKPNQTLKEKAEEIKGIEKELAELKERFSDFQSFSKEHIAELESHCADVLDSYGRIRDRLEKLLKKCVKEEKDVGIIFDKLLDFKSTIK